MKCINCGSEITNNLKFCSKCGAMAPQEAPAPVVEKTGAVKCRNCGSDIVNSFKFCSKCGATVEPDAFLTTAKEASVNKCNNCGNEISDDEMFCSKCGTPVNQSSISPYTMSKKNNKKLMIAIASAALALILIVVFIVSCNSCNTSLESKITSGAWVSDSTCYKFESNGNYIEVKEYGVDDSNDWSLIGDELHKGSKTYKYKPMKDSDIDRDYLTNDSDEWYVSDRYLVIGHSCYRAISNSLFESYKSEAEKNSEKGYDEDYGYNW